MKNIGATSVLDPTDDGPEVHIINMFNMFPKGATPVQLRSLASTVTFCMAALTDAMMAAFREGQCSRGLS